MAVAQGSLPVLAGAACAFDTASTTAPNPAKAIPGLAVTVNNGTRARNALVVVSANAGIDVDAEIRLAYSIDGGDWQPFAPKDGIFDDPTEDFSVKLPSGLAAGGHSLAVRAVDGADNVGAIQLTFRIK